MALILCPTDCATGGVPDVAFDLCTPQYKWGEINTILVAQVGRPLKVGDAAEISKRIANDSTAAGYDPADKMVVLKGFGDLPAGAGEPNRISSLYSITPPKQRTLNFTVLDLNNTNYEFARRVDKCGGKFLIWYQTAAGEMFGGEEFLAGNEVSLTGNHLIPQSDAENQTLQLTASWTGPMAERRVSVLA